MYITRDLEGALSEALRGGKVVILYGSRQTGKTTLIERLLADDELRRGAWSRFRAMSARTVNCLPTRR